MESILRIGGSVKAACAFAGISRQAYYHHYNTYMEFSQRMDKAQHYAIIAARQIVVRAIVESNDLETAKWYLEKHDIKSSGMNQQTQVNVFQNLKDQFIKHQEDGKDEPLPAPIVEETPEKPVEATPVPEKPVEKPQVQAPKVEQPKLRVINISTTDDAPDSNNYE